MGDTPDKIKWHPAFYAATELELQENIEQLEFKTEYNLSKEPIRIDLLIIKENENRIKNEIGHIMKTYNVIEYKSPEDNLSIDDFYKTLGYACLFKGYGKSVNAIPIEKLTVSIFREAYPRKMLLTLKQQGHKIEEKYAGIYYVYGFPCMIQIVVIKQLHREEHKSLKVLSINADKEDIKEFLKESESAYGPRERNNIDAVLQASVRANYELYEEVRRENTMCEALRELMKDEIEEELDKARTVGMAQGIAEGRAEGRAQGIAEGRAEGRAEGKAEGKAEGEANIIKIMYDNGNSFEQIAGYIGKSADDVKAIIEGNTFPFPI